ncbi:hypothetical protein ACQVP2_28200 [Methylobacterium aquaticum]|uniref:hypothetical protein n=1 Tax=Methylobacterium aquaticum TaxID=270351 RepID=UPI003D166CAF
MTGHREGRAWQRAPESGWQGVDINSPVALGALLTSVEEAQGVLQFIEALFLYTDHDGDLTHVTAAGGAAMARLAINQLDAARTVIAAAHDAAEAQ